jgi:hypothetical protein
MMLGGASFAVLMFAYNHVAYGALHASGYSYLLNSDAFSFTFFPFRFRHYTLGVLASLSSLVAAGWLALFADRRVSRRDRALLGSWFTAFFLFHCFYLPYGGEGLPRFLLPGIPALPLAFLLVVRDGIGFRPKSPPSLVWRQVAGAIVLGTALAMGGFRLVRSEVLSIRDDQSVVPQAVGDAARTLPEQSLVASSNMSGAIRFYTHLIPVRWDWIEPGQYECLQSKAEQLGYRWFALLMDFERDDAQRRMPGRWRLLQTYPRAALWAIEPAGHGACPK